MGFKALWLISNRDLFFVSVHKVDRNLVLSTRKMLWSVKRRHCQVKMSLVCLWTSSTAPSAVWLGPIHLVSMSLLWRYQRIEVWVKPGIRTPHYYETFVLSLEKESPYLFSKFNPLNTDTLLIRALLCPTRRPYYRIWLYLTYSLSCLGLE